MVGDLMERSGEEDHEMDPAELRARMEGPGVPVILDVREPLEYQLVQIPGSKLIPLMELPDRVHELSRADPIVVYCHVGIRSAIATRYLLDLGFEKVWNLRGGIDAYARKVDPSLPTY